MNNGLNRQRIFSSIDIGTTKIGTVVANVPFNGMCEIVGVGKHPSVGLRKGLIVDLESTISSIRESKNIAERMSGITIDKASVGVTGHHIQSIQSSAVVAVGDPHHGITADDKRRVIEVARKIDIPSGQRLIDVLVKEYIVDSQTGIKDPLGMSGLRLEVNALLITGAVMYIENIFRAVEATDVEIEDLFLDPVASGEAVLTNDEKESGVALVDIGGGTTDLAVYQDGCIAHTSILPIGGDHFDSDISYGLSIPVREAERIKCLIGGIDKNSMLSPDFVTILKPGTGEEQKVPVKIISEIIIPRMEEIMLLIKREISKAGLYGKIPAGMVITGGGAQLKGVVDFATNLLALPVRIGRPYNISGLREDVQSPIFSTGVGLIKLASNNHDLAEDYPQLKFDSHNSIINKFINRIVSIYKWYSQ